VEDGADLTFEVFKNLEGFPLKNWRNQNQIKTTNAPRKKSYRIYNVNPSRLKKTSKDVRRIQPLRFSRTLKVFIVKPKAA